MGVATQNHKSSTSLMLHIDCLYILYSSKLLRDKMFVKINFADQGFLLAMPFLAATCTICVYSKTCHARLLASKSKHFAQRPTSSRLPLLELINYLSQARDTSLLTNAMDVEGTYKSGPQESKSVGFEITVESHVALDVYAMVQKRNSCCFASWPYHKQFSQKVLRSLIFMLWEESAKSTKIMCFANLALYGSYRKQSHD